MKRQVHKLGALKIPAAPARQRDSRSNRQSLCLTVGMTFGRDWRKPGSSGDTCRTPERDRRAHSELSRNDDTARRRVCFRLREFCQQPFCPSRRKRWPVSVRVRVLRGNGGGYVELAHRHREAPPADRVHKHLKAAEPVRHGHLLLVVANALIFSPIISLFKG
jgi:hypothetical protein